MDRDMFVVGGLASWMAVFPRFWVYREAHPEMTLREQVEGAFRNVFA